MQTLQRCSYALASYDRQTQDHGIYLEKKRLLEQSCKNMVKQLKGSHIKEKMIAVNARYSEEKYLTACIYKGTLFVGFQDKETKQISLDDRSNAFVTMPNDSPSSLEFRIENAIADAEKNRENQMSKHLTPSWEKLAPMLDKIIEFENELKKLPESKRGIMERSGVKEQKINDIISREEKTLHPIIEDEMEKMTGMDIGAIGKRDEYSNMSYLEQDIAEKRHHKDMGEKGFVDADWHDKTHLLPLEERFEFAKREAKETVKDTPNERSVEREETEELVRIKY